MNNLPVTRATGSIVLFKTPEYQLSRAIGAIRSSRLPIDLHLVDNSPEPCLDPTRFLGVNYRHIGRNIGYGAGHNVALREILETSRFHFVFNPDIYFEPDALERIVEFMNRDADIGLVLPKVVYPDGELQYLCKLLPTPWDLVFRRFLPASMRPLFKARMDRYELRMTDYSHIMDVPFLSGCFMALNVDALRTAGLFDERYFMYLEDTDLSRRIAQNHRTTFFPEVTIVHDHARQSYRNGHMMRVHMASAIKYFNKWGWFIDPIRRSLNRRALRSLPKDAGTEPPKGSD